MSAIDFPANPGSLTPPNYWTANSGVQYRWDGEKWVSTGGSATYIGMGGTGANFVTGDIKFSDTKGVKFGAADDLAIYHDGTNNYIDFDTGELRLSVAGTSKMTLDSSGNVVFTGTVTGATPTATGHLTTKAYVDSAITAEDFWDRSGTTLSPNTAGDGVSFTGDLTVNTDALFVDASAKNVGIGTSSPSTTLHIKSTAYPSLIVERDHASYYGCLQILNSSTNGAQIDAIGDGDPSGGLRFFNVDDGTATLKMQLDSAGSLLIGGTLPSSPNITLTGSDGSAEFADDVNVGATTANATQGKILLDQKGRIDIHRRTGDSLDQVLQVYDTSSTKTIELFNNGSITAKDVQVGGKPDDGLNVGARVADFGYIASACPSGNTGLAIFNSDAPNSTANFKVTSDGTITADGSAEFAGDLTVNTDALFVDASAKNVGIGTTSPNQDLTISSGADKLHLFGSTAGNGGALFTTNSAFSDYEPLSLTGEYISFSTRTGTLTSSERMRIDSSGNVGIGESNPTRTLEVNSGITNVVANFKSTDSMAAIALVDNGGSAEYACQGNAAIIMPGGTEKMRIDSSGNVGIGTTSPAEKLSVNGKLKITNDIILAQTNGRIDYDNGNSSGALRFYSTSANAERLRILSTGGLTFNGDTAQANALDDYEEGSWTVTLVRQTSQPTVTYNRQDAQYTKIGNQVLVWWDMKVATNTGGSGYYAIGGLPYNAVTGGTGGGYGAPQFRSQGLLGTNSRLYSNSSYHMNDIIPLHCFNSSGTEVTATATTGRITGWSVYRTS